MLLNQRKFHFIYIILIVCLLFVGCSQTSSKPVKELSLGDEYVYRNRYWTLDLNEGELLIDVVIGADGLYYATNSTDFMKQTLYRIPHTAFPEEAMALKGITSAAEVIPLLEAEMGTLSDLFTNSNGELCYIYNVYMTEETASQLFVRKLGEDGAILSEIDITEAHKEMKLTLQGAEDKSPVTHITLDGEENIYFSSVGENGYIEMVDNSGVLSSSISLGDNPPRSICTGSDGIVYAVRHEMDENKILTVDSKGKKLSEKLSVSDTTGIGILGAGLDGNLLYGNHVYLYNLNPLTLECEPLFLWANNGISGKGVKQIYAMQDESLLTIVRDSEAKSRNAIVYLNKIAKEDLPEVQIVTLEADEKFVSDELRMAVSLFNSTNLNYQVEFKAYGSDRLLTEIISGDGPDLISRQSIEPKLFMQKGLVEDLSPYLEKSNLLSREDLTESVLRCNTFDDNLICIPPVFQLNVLAGKQSLLGDSIDWNIEDFMAFVMEHSGAEIFEGGTLDSSKEMIVLMNMRSQPEKYVNWDTHTAHFDSPEFLELLRFASAYEVKYQNNDKSVEAKIMEEEVLLYDRGINTVEEYLLNRERFQGDIHYIGYPSETDGPNYGISNWLAYAINSQSDVKEGAWAFLEYLVLLQQGSHANRFNLPTLKSALNDKFEEATIPKIFLNNAGIEVEHPLYRRGTFDNIQYEVYAVDEAELEPLRYMIDNARYLDGQLSGDINSIISEEISALFSGGKSEEDTAQTIQNRVQLYLNEFK